MLSWSRGGAAGAHAGPVEPCQLHSLSQPWIFQYSQWIFQNNLSITAKYAYAQGLSQNFILLGVVETWGKSYSLPHREIWGGGAVAEGITPRYTVEMKVCNLFTSRCA